MKNLIGEQFDQQLRANPIDLVDGELGQVVHGERSWEIFPEDESVRLISVRELVQARINAVMKLNEQSDLVKQDRFKVMGSWMDRYTTSTNLVHGLDGRIHFCDIDLNRDWVRKAINEGLRDGAFNYTEIFDHVMDHSYASLDYKKYLDAKGGAFVSREFGRHPVFAAACGFAEGDSSKDLYAQALDYLDNGLIHKPGWHSGWVPGEIPVGYGRPIALGLGEASFYPPNNSTKHHAGIHVDA